MQKLLGDSQAASLCNAITNTEPQVSIRVNPLKNCPNPLIESSDLVPWCSTGKYLAARPSFTLDPLFHAGTYYVQEASSMFIEYLYRNLAEVPMRVLDLCAAPGGKATLWRSLLPDGALLVANEPVQQRAMILCENMLKWGHPDVVVTKAMPRDFGRMAGFFDLIAADVPCSGEGMFRKDPESVTQWSESNVQMCAARQFEIISDVWPALKEGGYLVYSTCTYNALENEENVQRICNELGAEAVSLSPEKSWNVQTNGIGWHFYPHLTRGEGFYAVLLRKVSEQRPNKRRKIRLEVVKTDDLLRNPADFQYYKNPKNRVEIFALKKTLGDDVATLFDCVNVINAGVPIGETVGKKTVPHQGLALSTALFRENCREFPLDLEQAIAYLRRENIQLPVGEQKGYALVTYHDVPLGWVNYLGNRCNNIYPQEWRIRQANVGNIK